MNDFLLKLGKRALAHRYRYYVLDDPEIPDSEYDLLERYYEDLCNQYNIHPLTDMVGWDFNKPQAQEVAKEVDNWEDSYSQWLLDMFPVWKSLGFPNKGKYVISLSNRAMEKYNE